MSILNKYKHWESQLLVIKDRFYDFVISKDNTKGVDIDGKNTENECLSVYIDMSSPECFVGDSVVSKSEFTWKDAINDGAELYDIGFTGMDNGIIKFDKDTISDYDFFNRLTKSEIIIPSGDTRLTLKPVDGNTKAHSYEICKNNGYLSFKGGFLQGFYKLQGFDYEVLPLHIEDEMVLEFTLRPMTYVTPKDTLNDFYPNNRGLFFYVGTRAENKFAKMYGTDLDEYPDRRESGETTCYNYFYDDYFTYEDGCQRIEQNAQDLGGYFLDDYLSSDEWLNNKADLDSGETFDITSEKIYDSEGDELTAEIIGEMFTDNKFLFFNRTSEGFTVDTWDEAYSGITLQYPKAKLNANLFLLMNRTKTGLTAEDKDKILSGEYSYDIITDSLVINESGDTSTNNYDIKSDIYNNAFGLGINDEGGVYYRYLVKDCNSETGYSIEEESTFPNMVETGKWATIAVRIKILNGGLDDCGQPTGNRKMKIFIYVNGYLKLVSKELDAFNFHELNDVYRRQETVPYNMSLGGGTQGLAESIWVRYKEKFPKILPIEENFAGSFIGDIKTFKIYTCGLQYNQIKNNSMFENKNIIQ